MYLDLFPHSDTIFCIFKISIYGVQCCCIPLYYRLVKVSHVPHSFCWTPGLQSADLLLWILCEELHLIGTVVQVLSCQTRLISRTFLGENQFSATDAYDHTESYRLHGFCLTITFLFNSSTPGRFPLKLPCLLKDLLVLFVWICYSWQILVVSKTGNPSISMAISIINGH